MEIIEFIVDVIEAIAHWRATLMAIVGVILAVIMLVWLGANPPGIIAAIAVFLASFMWGLRWHKRSVRVPDHWPL